MEQAAPYIVTTPVYPDVAIQSNEPAAAAIDMLPCPFCGAPAELRPDERGCHFIPHCTVCDGDIDNWCLGADAAIAAWNTRAAASRDTSLIGFVDDLLDVLQEVGGMSAEWCETEMRKFETLLREG